MKTGYSMLLGEYIDAEQIEYGDCERFQIVCPPCYEPVFKVVRTDKTPYVHFLSHYNAGKSYAVDCENRVKGMTCAEIEAKNAESREQRLVFFLSVLRSLINGDPFYTESAHRSHMPLNRSKAISAWKDIAYDMSRKLPRDDQFIEGAFDDYIAGAETDDWKIHTTFSRRTQKRIAKDIWFHLLSGKGRANFDFLFNHGYLGLLARLWNDQTRRASSSSNKYVFYLTRLLQVNRKHGLNLLHEMENTLADPPQDDNPCNYFRRLTAWIVQEIQGTLLQLPYYELLKNELDKTGYRFKVYPANDRTN